MRFNRKITALVLTFLVTTGSIAQAAPLTIVGKDNNIKEFQMSDINSGSFKNAWDNMKGLDSSYVDTDGDGIGVKVSDFLAQTEFKSIDAFEKAKEKTIGVDLKTVVSPVTASKTFDIVGVTDFHGSLLDSKNNYVGAGLGKVVKDIKALNPTRTLIIGGGDLYQGSPVSNVLRGVPVQQTLTNMGMEVTTLGNQI